MAAHRASIALRLGLYYAAIFAVLGVHLPFFPVLLEGRGLDAGQIGIVLGAGIWVRLVASPLAAQWVDRSGRARAAIVALAAVAAAAYAALAIAGTFAAILAAMVVFGATYPTLMPLGDHLAQLARRRHGLSYGRLRLWGSLGFLLATAGAGQVLRGRAAEDVFAWTLVGLGAVVLVATALPALTDRDPRPPGAPIGALLRDRGFRRLLLIAGLVQGSHAAYYAFATLHWEHAGLDRGTIGLLWAEGVLAEIALFTVGAQVVARLGAGRLLVAGGVAATARWLVTAQTTALPALIAVQWLHALSFGATWLASIQLIADRVPAHAAATAQSLLSAVATGAGTALATMLAGFLFERGGPLAFAAMAGLAALGAAVAVVTVAAAGPRRRRPGSTSTPGRSSCPPAGPGPAG